MHIKIAKFHTSAPDLESCPDSDLPEFAFIGRSNVGKSSLINLLAGQKDLARVSATPGHTKLINFFAINNSWHLVDLPGYGHAQTNKREQERFQQMIATYLTGRSNLATVFVLIDSRLSPQQIDLDFLQWLEGYGVPFVLVFTKTDKLKPRQLKANLELFRSRMAECCQSEPKAFTTSAEARQGRHELLSWIAAALAQ
jgi:GTP-binding protein